MKTQSQTTEMSNNEERLNRLIKEHDERQQSIKALMTNRDAILKKISELPADQPTKKRYNALKSELMDADIKIELAKQRADAIQSEIRERTPLEIRRQLLEMGRKVISLVAEQSRIVREKAELEFEIIRLQRILKIFPEATMTRDEGLREVQ